MVALGEAPQALRAGDAPLCGVPGVGKAVGPVPVTGLPRKVTSGVSRGKPLRSRAVGGAAGSGRSATSRMASRGRSGPDPAPKLTAMRPDSDSPADNGCPGACLLARRARWRCQQNMPAAPAAAASTIKHTKSATQPPSSAPSAAAGFTHCASSTSNSGGGGLIAEIFAKAFF